MQVRAFERYIPLMTWNILIDSKYLKQTDLKVWVAQLAVPK